MKRSRFTSSGDYPVGYRRPPKHKQFKPGVCPNPGGRPKGVPNVDTVLREAMLEGVTITENGAKRRVTKLEAIIKRLVDRGTDGDLRAIAMLFEKLDGQQKVSDPQSIADRDQDDKAVLEAAIARMRKSPDDSNGQ